MYTYKKSERLCNKKLTENLFLKGSSISVDSFRLVYIEDKNKDVLLKSQIIVSKRNIGKAVDRNFIKRQIRESYRKNKHLIFDSLKKNSKSLNVAIIYQESSKIPSIIIDEEIQRLFHRLLNVLWRKFWQLSYLLYSTFIRILFHLLFLLDVDLILHARNIQKNRL